MASTRQKRHPAAFKAKVALEADEQTRTLAELSRGASFVVRSSGQSIRTCPSP
jgi:hypothetical protein